MHIIVESKQCVSQHREETAGGQILKPVYVAKTLNNKRNVATEMLYDCNCLGGRNTKCTVCWATWPLLLLNGFCTLNRFTVGDVIINLRSVWFSHNYSPLTLH